MATAPAGPKDAMTTEADHKETVQYWGVSLFSSTTFWFNVITGIVSVLSLTEVVTIFPPRFAPIAAAIVATGNVYLRTQTVRPVALIRPGKVKVVKVRKIGPPPPPLVTD